MRARVLYGVLVVLYLLHSDLWLWHEGRLVLGLPAGLLYHVVYCLAAAAAMAAVVRWAWPPGLDAEDGDGAQGSEPRA